MPRGGRRTRSGPPPKPTELRVLHGSKRGKADRAAEPQVELGVPTPLGEIDDVGAGAWDSLAETLLSMRVLSKADGLALEMLVAVYSEWRSAQDEIERDGATQTVETQHGSKMQNHPAVARRSDAWRRLHAMAQEFGLTPAARTRVKAGSAPPAADPLEELTGRGA